MDYCSTQNTDKMATCRNKKEIRGGLSRWMSGYKLELENLLYYIPYNIYQSFGLIRKKQQSLCFPPLLTEINKIDSIL